MRHVYFAQREPDGLIKIGISHKPRQRCQNLWAPDAGIKGLTLLATIPVRCSRGVYVPLFIQERLLQLRFADAREVGEWFRPTPRLVRFIDHIADRQAVA